MSARPVTQTVVPSSFGCFSLRRMSRMTFATDVRVWPTVTAMPAKNTTGSAICHHGVGSSATSTITVSMVSVTSGMGISTVLCSVMMHSGSTNEATAVVSNTMRLSRWNVSRLSNSR